MTDTTLFTAGSLFTSDYLTHGIRDTAEYAAVDPAALGTVLATLFDAFPIATQPNEAQTEDDLIWPVLAALGWTEVLRQQNLTVSGREDVPDGLMFADAAAKAQANASAQEWQRYTHGLAVVESKRWGRPLDRAGRRDEATAPSTQMLRYLRRIDDLTRGRLRWGILTNGGRWRLYWAGARSVSEEFLEIDLARVLGRADDDLFAGPADREHWLRVFAVMFGRTAFLPDIGDQTFHARALRQAAFYEERVAASLANLVFSEVFPAVSAAIARAAPNASLQDVREASLVLLYRLLFLLYAEDRGLLPVRDRRYDDYALRPLREDIGRRMGEGDAFSASASPIWNRIGDLSRMIDKGDASVGLPPYNGGLFSADKTPLLDRIRIPDAVMALTIDALSFERTGMLRRYINYRDLSVQQLGSIYERLLEHELTVEDGALAVRPNAFARKNSGSYYTPDELVGLILDQTLEPLIAERRDAFAAALAALRPADSEDYRRRELDAADPAEAILSLRVLDPAMGSGHFLVSLVDTLTDHVLDAMAEVAVAGASLDHRSPLAAEIVKTRNRILGNARAANWAIEEAQLDDRHIVRRMVLKRCIYGVDKNPMAVELAKVALWLHTFTVGAPLSFVDHHLRAGDSLFGLWVRDAIDSAAAWGGGQLLYAGPLREAQSAAAAMQIIERLTDAEIAEAHQSADTFYGVQQQVAPLDGFLAFLHALDWLNLKNREDKAAVRAWLDGVFGNPIDIVRGRAQPLLERDRQHGERFGEILAEACALIEDERFLNWQVTFPGVWTNWSSGALHGGFDAVVGNPPWDRIKLQQVEWFAARRPEIARATRASDRARMIAAVKAEGDSLASDFALADSRAAASLRMARTAYPLLGRGDVNLYSLFVERAHALAKPTGMVGLLTPSGIASDLSAASFFRKIAVGGHLKALYDFENRGVFFPDVHRSFKFAAMVSSPGRTFPTAQCGFFLKDVAEIADHDRSFVIPAAGFAAVNPNTGTAPIFRSRRDMELTTRIYGRLPILVDRSGGTPSAAWPVRYATMFHMTNDSHLFRTRAELEEQEGAWPSGGNRFASAAGDWVPLYEGKMVQAFDHRAASVVVNPANVNRPAQPLPTTDEQHRDPAWLPAPQFWVTHAAAAPKVDGWVLGFKEITAPTNIRTMIAAIFPSVGFGNKVPIFAPTTADRQEWLLLANLNAFVFDYVTRQKIQGQTLNLFIVEQLPVVPPTAYDRRFGDRTAADIVRASVLELSYTAHDLAPFARDLGHVDEDGAVLPPFAWDEERRLRLRARLDALYFILYGVTDREDVRYIFSTFPIVEREETAVWGRYRSRDLTLAWINALNAGQPDAEIDA
ncbi:Eco57I restriction-modification methylase domain-containing protein [Sphingomonas sp. 2378]|uniref:Eco57I restriction-modification methylase domain-containing protein n=1 Tax=Sphingomonas sp. 2378 TaxID=1219748 RepID=UPI00311AC809